MKLPMKNTISITAHYKVDVEQADGDFDLNNGTNRGDAGDPWPGTSVNRNFHENSIPNSRDYNGNDTAVTVREISNSAPTMTADLYVVEESPSCPSLYFWNGNDYERRGFVLEGAMPRENEYRDYTPLRRSLVPKDGEYLLQIRETEPEISFTDMVKLIILDHSSGARYTMPMSAPRSSGALPLRGLAVHPVLSPLDKL